MIFFAAVAEPVSTYERLMCNFIKRFKLIFAQEIWELHGHKNT